MSKSHNENQTAVTGHGKENEKVEILSVKTNYKTKNIIPDEDLHNSHSSLNLTRIIKAWRM
jgi:hypothetical protein